MTKRLVEPFASVVLKRDANLVELVVAVRTHLRTLPDLFSEFVQDDDSRRLSDPSYSDYNQRLIDWQAMRMRGETEQMPPGLAIYFVSTDDRRGVFIGLDDSVVGCTDELTAKGEKDLFRIMAPYLENRSK